MYKLILIMPKKAALIDLPDASVDYIFCTLDELPINSRENILHLTFADTEIPEHPYAFTRKHAESIVNFVNRSGAHDTLIVSCDSGESRSPAIAAALLRYQQEIDSEIWASAEYHPNRLVYNICRKVMGS